MAITKVAETTFTATTTAADKTLPGTLAQNDIVIVVMGCDASLVPGTSGILTAGYTEIDFDTAATPGRAVGYKRMGATPDTVVNVKTGTGIAAGLIQVWRGVDATTALAGTTTSAVGNDASPNPPSHTTNAANALRVVIAVLDDDDSSHTAPTGYGDLVTANTGQGSTTTGATVSIASKIQATAGAEDPAAFTGGSSDQWVAYHLSLKAQAATAYTLDADPGAVAIGGTAASLARSWQGVAEAGAVVIAGTAAELTYTPAPGEELNAEPGAVAIAGTAAGLTVQRVLLTGFDPRSLGLTVFLDPSDIGKLWQDSARTTPVTADGDVVGSFDDKSGNGYNVLQGTTANKPIYKTASGLHWLEFDGTDDFLTNSSVVPGADKLQVWTGWHKDTDGTEKTLVGFGTAPADAGFEVQPTSFHSSPKGPDIQSMGFTYSSGYVNSVTAPVTKVYYASIDRAAASAAASFAMRLNGVPQTLSLGGGSDPTNVNFGTFPLWIGRRYGTSLPFDGKLFGVFFRFGSFVGAADIAAGETWIGDKTGVPVAGAGTVGTVVIAGTAAELTYAQGGAEELSADAGAVAIAGTAATLHLSHVVQAEPGAVAIAGTAATLTRSLLLVNEPGAVAIAGTAATLQLSQAMQAASGAVAITGTAATLELDRMLAANAGAVVITGTDAALVTVGSVVLIAEEGAVAIAGQAATLTAARTIAAGAGAVAIAGTAATLARSQALAATAGAFTIQGTAAGLAVAHAIAVEAGAFTVAGTAATLLTNYRLTVEPATFTIDGTDAGLFYEGAHPILPAEPGAVVITGTDATFEMGIWMPTPALLCAGIEWQPLVDAGVLAAPAVSADVAAEALADADIYVEDC